MSANRRDTWTRGLCLGVILLSVVEFLVATIGVQIRNLPRSTDFASYYLAGVSARQGISPYDHDAQQQLGRQHQLGFEAYPFLYPPAFALVMQPLGDLSYPRARQAWMLLSTLALLAALALTWRLTWQLADLLEVQNRAAVWIVLAAFTAASLNSTGVHNDIRAGSVGILLYLCGAGMATALLQQRAAAGGALLGLATVLKLTPAAIFAWMAWRRRWTWLLVGASILLLAALASEWHWGFGIHREYVESALWPALGGEFPRPMNQSLDAAWSRLLVPSPLVQSPFDAPRLKVWLSVSTSVALLLISLRRLARVPWTPTHMPLAFGMFFVLLLVLMKITWLHTLTAILFVWPVVMVHVLATTERGSPLAARLGFWACVGFFLSAAHLPVLWESLRSGAGVLLINTHLYGLLILWWVCVRLLRVNDRG
jgi:hypothetical protein